MCGLGGLLGVGVPFWFCGVGEFGSSCVGESEIVEGAVGMLFACVAGVNGEVS